MHHQGIRFILKSTILDYIPCHTLLFRIAGVHELVRRDVGTESPRSIEVAICFWIPVPPLPVSHWVCESLGKEMKVVVVQRLYTEARLEPLDLRVITRGQDSVGDIDELLLH